MGSWRRTLKMRGAEAPAVASRKLTRANHLCMLFFYIPYTYIFCLYQRISRSNLRNVHSGKGRVCSVKISPKPKCKACKRPIPNIPPAPPVMTNPHNNKLCGFSQNIKLESLPFISYHVYYIKHEYLINIILYSNTHTHYSYSIYR